MSQKIHTWRAIFMTNLFKFIRALSISLALLSISSVICQQYTLADRLARSLNIQSQHIVLATPNIIIYDTPNFLVTPPLYTYHNGIYYKNGFPRNDNSLILSGNTPVNNFATREFRFDRVDNTSLIITASDTNPSIDFPLLAELGDDKHCPAFSLIEDIKQDLIQDSITAIELKLSSLRSFEKSSNLIIYFMQRTVQSLLAIPTITRFHITLIPSSSDTEHDLESAYKEVHSILEQLVKGHLEGVWPQQLSQNSSFFDNSETSSAPQQTE